MTKQQKYNRKVARTLTISELYNFEGFYLNPKNIEYHTNYINENYEQCWEYLMKHRKSLKGDLNDQRRFTIL